MDDVLMPVLLIKLWLGMKNKIICLIAVDVDILLLWTSNGVHRPAEDCLRIVLCQQICNNSVQVQF